MRNLEVIGEAGKKLPATIRARHPDTEWAKIAALRDVLSHEYFGLDEVIIWDVVQNKLASLEKEVCKIRSP